MTGKWQTLGVLYAIVSFGFSQIFFNLVQVNPRAFPVAPGFAIWTLLWLQVIPLAILFLLDRFTASNDLTLRIWRAVLCLLLAASLLKQFSVFHQDFFTHFLRFIPAAILYGLVCGCVLVIMVISPRLAHGIQTYLAFAGILALAFPIIFLYSLFSVTNQHPQGVVQNSDVCERCNSSIYVVVFDELSLQALLKNDKIDASQFPNFAALAGDSIWFRNATTNHWGTVNSIPSLLTGKINPTYSDATILDFVPSNMPKTVLLSEVEVENWLRYSHNANAGIEFRGKGFFLNRHPWLTAKFIGYRLWGFFTFHLPQNILFDDPEYHVTTAEQEDLFLDAIQSRQPQFVMWHCSLPHSPFIYGADGSARHEYPDFFPFEKEYKTSSFPLIFSRYREQARFADLILGRILERMKSTGAYRDSILIVASDHGLRIWGDVFNNVDLLARVPVFFHIPGREPAVIESNFQLCDLAPTLLDAFGCSPSIAKFDGFSGLHPAPPDRIASLHFYPAKVVYDLNPATNQWNLSANAEHGVGGIVAPLQRGFYAVHVFDDVMAAREERTDFLTRYLDRHFPISVTDQDVQQLKRQIQQMQNEPTTARYQFTRGMYYFFLALTETQLVADGEKLDTREITSHWITARDLLKLSGGLSPWIGESVGQLIEESDRNHDKQLDEKELSAIIRNRRGGLK
ncbi:MAG: hypothetical protein C5B54_11045 [Acidobacteria bacterium]|nr:MAG: hypothetical protein C5B54_11045 [Acidobacteriota bacterium]